MKKVFSKMHFGLLLLMLSYSIVGLVMIFSSSSVAAVLRYQVASNHFFIRQLIFLFIGFIGGILIIHIPTKIYRRVSKLAMMGIIFLLFFLFVAGSVAGGALSWYDFGIVNFQPTELAKIILIVYLAVYYHKLRTKKGTSFFQMIFPLILAAIIFILIALQPDFGGAFIIFVIAACIFLSLPFGKAHKITMYKVCGVGTLLLAVAILCFGKTILNSYQVSRLLNFKEPCQRYQEESGYQVCNGYIAIHNGGLFGVGLGNSSQKYLYLPEAHTDFIFAIICEELGIIIGIIIVLGYFLMLFYVYKVAKEADNLRNSILAYGVFVYIAIHILINLLGILGLIPLTGVPLPFLSYGGSYNLCVLISLFIVQRVHIENKIDKQRRRIENL